MRKLTIKILIVFIFSSLINNCGFRVIYDKKESDLYIKELVSIKIQKKRDKIYQDFKNKLYDIFNPQKIEGEKKYILIYNISQSISSTYISETGSSGRNKLTLNVDFKLKDISNGKVISSGYSNVSDNFDVSDNRYATYVTQDYVKNNLLNIVARDIRNSIVNDFTKLAVNNDKNLKN